MKTRENLTKSNLVVYVCSRPHETSAGRENDFIGHNMFHDEFYSLHNVETLMKKCVDITFDVSCCRRYNQSNQSSSEENSNSVNQEQVEVVVKNPNESSDVLIYCLLDEYADFLRTVFCKLDDSNNKMLAPFRLANKLLFWLFCNFHALRANLKLTHILQFHWKVLHSEDAPVPLDYYDSYVPVNNNIINNGPLTENPNPNSVAAAGDPPAPAAPTSSSSLIFE